MFVITAFLANWLVGERCVAPNLSCALPSADRKYCLRCESAAQLTRGLSGDDIAQLTCAGMPPDRSVAVRFSAHMLVDDAPDTRRQAGVQLSVDATQDGSKSLTADRVLVDGQLESSMSLAVSAKVPASGAAAGVVIASTKLSRCIFAKDQNPAVPGHCSTSPPGRIEIEVK